MLLPNCLTHPLADAPFGRPSTVSHVLCLQEPTKCTKCDATFTMKLMHNRCTFMNKQVIKMQESPSNIPEGETPHSVMAYCYDHNVDGAKPGDRIVMTGKCTFDHFVIFLVVISDAATTLMTYHQCPQ